MTSLPLIQADEFLPEWVMQYVGAFRTYASRMSFYLSVPNTLMIAVLFYDQSPIVQSVFPSVYWWVGFILVVIVPGAIFTDRFLFHPAQITYDSHQGARENRNPTYQELMKVSRQLDAIETQLDDVDTEFEAGSPVDELDSPLPTEDVDAVED